MKLLLGGEEEVFEEEVRHVRRQGMEAEGDMRPNRGLVEAALLYGVRANMV